MGWNSGRGPVGLVLAGTMAMAAVAGGALWWGWGHPATAPPSAGNLDREIHYMEAAFAQIGASSRRVGLPIGAVVVWHDRIVGLGHNRNRIQGSPIEHAEMQAIDDAITHFHALGPRHRVRQRLRESTVYTTLEPCPMCAGTMLMARVRAVVYCMPDRPWGAAGTAGVLAGFPRRLEARHSGAPVCGELAGLRFQDKATQDRLWELGQVYKAAFLVRSGGAGPHEASGVPGDRAIGGSMRSTTAAQVTPKGR